MKRKIFSILFALVLVLSLSLVTAVPVVAVEPGDLEFGTEGDGTAEWTTEEAHSGSYSVKFHAENWGPDAYALGIPVDVPLNEITTLSYWRNGLVFDYAPPAVLLCIDANNDGELDFNTQDAIDVLMAWEESSLLGEDAILGIEADWTDTGWTMVDVLAKDWRWGGAWWFDKTGWSGWVTLPSLQEFINAGGFGPSDAGFPCPIDPTDSVMLLAMAGCNPDGDLYIDDISMNGVTYDFEPPPVIEVEVDIKPGSDPNSINPKGKGVIPVAILGSDTFDVTDVDVETLEFGPDKATPVHDLTDPDVYAEHLQDVNGDTFTDLVSHYRTQDTGIAQGDTDATLTGQTTGGILIAGTDSVRTVGKP